MLSNFLLDSATPWQSYFQDPATPIMEGVINLHHDLMFFITFIFFFVLIVLGRTLFFTLLVAPKIKFLGEWSMALSLKLFEQFYLLLS